MRQPNLVSFSSDSLADKVEVVCGLLALPQPRVAQWLVENPVVRGAAGLDLTCGACLRGLPAGPGSLPAPALAAARQHAGPRHAARLRSPGASAGRPPPVLPRPLTRPAPPAAAARQVLTMGAATLRAHWEHLQRVLDAGTRQLSRAVLAHPHLLTFASEMVDAQLDDLAVVSGLSAADVAAMVLQNPRLLKSGSATWQANMRSLQQALGLGQAQAQALVRHSPRLLLVNEAQLAALCAQLAALLDAVPAWRDEVRAAARPGASRASRAGVLRRCCGWGMHAGMHAGADRVHADPAAPRPGAGAGPGSRAAGGAAAAQPRAPAAAALPGGHGAPGAARAAAAAAAAAGGHCGPLPPPPARLAAEPAGPPG